MRRLVFGPILLALAAIPATARYGDRGMVVHEWGTFLAMAGSDGVTLDGMYHEEHALPSFVHSRSKDQLRMRSVSLKGETPVIYFYTDRPQQVNVRVKFPEGIWTQWYPQASMVAPGLAAAQPQNAKGGHICWNLEVVPPDDSTLADSMPPAHSDALWNYSRQVDAAFVRGPADKRTGGRRESERFIFYRGLGRAKLPLQVAGAGGGSLKLGSLPGGALKHLFVIRVENGAAAYRYIPSLAEGNALDDVIPSLQGAADIASFSRRIGAELADRLEQTGLYRKEAEAMVNTWRKSYFETDGVRVLFVLPQEWTDSFIPMDVHPKPAKLVRVMVGRTELLTPERESKAEAAVRDLVSSERAARIAAFAYLRGQGRYIEPIVNRVLRTTKSEAVRQASRRLLMTDFVTELRSAVHSAADGSKVQENPAEVRANLASILRELGYPDQAAEEARTAESLLGRLPQPKLDDPDSRWYLRAFARAKEGLGDDRAAADYYEKLVRFGSLSKTCGGCHEAAGPKSMAFYRDWWAGRKYADYTQKLGRISKAIQEQKDSLTKNPSDIASQMMLAYLSERAGDQAASDRHWARILGRPIGLKAANDTHLGIRSPEPGMAAGH